MMAINKSTLFACGAVGLILVISLTRAADLNSTTDTEEEVEVVEAAAPVGFDINKIEGTSQCVDCHRAEYDRWQASTHGGRAFDDLRGSAKSPEYAEAVGIPFEEVTRQGMCITCHATPQKINGEFHVLSNISCESCHSPSGGPDGWLNIHAVYGPNGTSRDYETLRHYEYRTERCQEAGQLRSSDTYGLIKRCAACHIPSEETLYEAGHDHKHGGYEFVTKALGEVRHNTFLDPDSNEMVASLWLSPFGGGEDLEAENHLRLMYVVGYLVDLEVSMANLAKSMDVESDYAVDLADRILDGFEDGLEEFLDSLDESELPILEEILELVEPIYTKIDDDGVEEFTEEDLLLCKETAQDLSLLIRQFAEKHATGAGLYEIEEPELPDDYE